MNWNEFIEQAKDYIHEIGGPIKDRPDVTEDDAKVLERLAERVREKLMAAHTGRCQACASLIDGKVVTHDKGLYPTYCILKADHDGPHKSKTVQWPDKVISSGSSDAP